MDKAASRIRLPLALQNEYTCNAKGVHWECKSCPFAAKCSFFAFVYFADFSVCRYNLLSISGLTKIA